MAKLAGTLLVGIAANTKDLVKGMKKAESLLKRFSRNAKRLLAVTAAVIGVRQLTQAYTDATRKAKELVNVSKQLGITTKEASIQKFIWEDAGSSLNNYSDAVKTLQKNLYDLTQGSKNQLGEALGSMGIDTGSLMGMGSVEQFDYLMSKLKEVTDQTKRMALAQKLFGEDSGKVVTGLVNEYQQLKSEMESLQPDSMFVSMNAMADTAIRKLGASFDKLKQTLSGVFGPTIMAGIRKMTELLSDAADYVKKYENEFSAAGDMINISIQIIVEALSAVWSGAKAFVESFKWLYHAAAKWMKSLVVMVKKAIEALMHMLGSALKKLGSKFTIRGRGLDWARTAGFDMDKINAYNNFMSSFGGKADELLNYTADLKELNTEIGEHNVKLAESEKRIKTYSDQAIKAGGSAIGSLFKMFGADDTGNFILGATGGRDIVGEVIKESLADQEKAKQNAKEMKTETKAVAENIKRAGGGAKGAKKAIKDAKDETSTWKDIANTIASSFESLFDSLMEGGKSLGESLKQIFKDLLKQMIKVLFISKLTKGISGLAGGLSSSGVTAFAKGGVVGTPTLFNTNTGLLGESGPEAILPLTRTSNGNLGVQAQTNPVNINVINNSSSGVDVKQNSDGSVDIIIQQLSQQILRGQGTFPEAIESRYGLMKR